MYIFFHHSFFHLQTLVIGQFSDVGSKRCRGSIAKRVEFRGTFGSPSCNGKLDSECVLTIIVSPPKIQNFHYLTIWILKELLKNLWKYCDDFYVFIFQVNLNGPNNANLSRMIYSYLLKNSNCQVWVRVPMNPPKVRYLFQARKAILQSFDHLSFIELNILPWRHISMIL